MDGYMPRLSRPVVPAIAAGAVALVLLLPRPAVAQHKYVGVSKCRVCHMNAKLGGDNYNAWKVSAHARAFETLGSEKARTKGKELGIADPQTSPRCLKCHATAFGAPADLRGPGVKNEDGVSCEGCHGAGFDYQANEVMRDKKVAAAKGLAVVDEKVCRGCHNEESPFYKPFDFKSFFAKIAHPKSGKRVE